MNDAAKQEAMPEEMLSQCAGRALETWTVWTEANQRVMRVLVDLSATTAKETARLYSEWQARAVETLRESQAFRLARSGQAPSTDPLGWYHAQVQESFDGAQRALRMIAGNAQAATTTTERLQASAERTGKEIQETFTTLATKLQGIHSAA
jgi:hypothetical protein